MQINYNFIIKYSEKITISLKFLNVKKSCISSNIYFNDKTGILASIVEKAYNLKSIKKL